MAFVSETQRKVNQISKTMCPLGPGQYFKDQQVKLKRDSAPFHSTSRRRTFLDINDKQKPGPGNYQISKPFIQPNIKTVSNSQSIIVKINSTGTAQFKSVVDRFQVRDHQVPGPGKYPNKQEMAKTPKRSSSHEAPVQENKIIQKLKQLTKKNYPAIPQKVRGLTDAKKQEIDQKGQLGPAFYNPNKNSYLNSTSTVWGKDKSRRFSLDSRAQVGPGKYNGQYNPIKPEDKVNQPSSNFKSSLVRTYWDSIFYKTNLDQTAKVRQQSNFKTKQPAPGQYETNSSSLKVQEKPFSFQFFGSTVQRFPEKQTADTKKHKSFYNIKSQIGQNRSFNKSDHAFLCDQKRNPQFLKVVEKQKNPGPGHYRQNVKIQKKLKGQKVQKFGSNTKRLFQVQDKADQVGPGKYQKNSNQENNIKNSRFGQVKDVSSNFRSTIGRDCFGINNNETFPFAQYDVSQYDLSKKMERQKNFLENLKKIDVEKAPFQSTISRFPHYQKKKDIPKNPVQQSKEQQLKIKQEADKVRQMILEANKTQTKPTEKNQFGKTQRFKQQKRGAPSVGSYSLKASWQKKSHNIKYQHK